ELAFPDWFESMSGCWGGHANHYHRQPQFIENNQKLTVTTLGIVVGNRGFFPAHLCESGRRDILRVLQEEGIKAITLPVEASKFGAVESLADAQKCADLFKAHREEISGVLVTLPNFGDERAVANTLRWAGLNVPVLVHAFNDDGKKMTIRDRRDS